MKVDRIRIFEGFEARIAKWLAKRHTQQWASQYGVRAVWRSMASRPPDLCSRGFPTTLAVCTWQEVTYSPASPPLYLVSPAEQTGGKGQWIHTEQVSSG